MPETRTAALKTIVLADLLSRDPIAINDLFTACRDAGFFYLRLTGRVAERLNPLVQELEVFNRDIFNVSAEEKSKYDFAKLGRRKTNGYKFLGTESGVLPNRKDGYELYTISQTDLLNQSPTKSWMCPNLAHMKKDLLTRFLDECRWISEVILEQLSISLGFREEHHLMKYHNTNSPSPTSLSFLRYPAYSPGDQNVGHYAHTDVGSLTLLHATTLGLQILDRQTEEWLFVRPVPNYFVVNVGDSLNFLSNGKLQSSLHRVVPHQSTKGVTRYSIAYFLRPNDSCSLKDQEGNIWLSQEWHEKKFQLFAAPLCEQSLGSMLTGKDGFTGPWEEEAYNTKIL